MKPRPSLSEAFEQRYIPEPNSGCWLWTGETERNGYGIYVFKKIPRGNGKYTKKRIKAHRLSWNLHCGEIPDGLEVCHSCDVPWCVNPEHLFVATHAENMADRDNKNRVTHGEQISWHKLTARDVIEIRASTETGFVLGERYGVSFQTISDIRRGVMWKRAELSIAA